MKTTTSNGIISNQDSIIRGNPIKKKKKIDFFNREKIFYIYK